VRYVGHGSGVPTVVPCTPHTTTPPTSRMHPPRPHRAPEGRDIPAVPHTPNARPRPGGTRSPHARTPACPRPRPGGTHSQGRAARAPEGRAPPRPHRPRPGGTRSPYAYAARAPVR